MNRRFPYCQYRETDYTQDEQIKALLRRGLCSETILSVCFAIKEKGKSSILKLPCDLDLQYISEQHEVHTINAAVEFICRRDSSILFDCIDKLSGIPMLLQVRGAFSTLLSVTGGNFLFRRMVKSEAEILKAIECINTYTANLIQEAVRRGTAIISFADPSAIPEVIGEERSRKYSVDAAYRLMRLVDPCLDQSVMHICPRTSFALESCKLCSCRKQVGFHQTLINELLLLSSNKKNHFTGHICIHHEKDLANGLSVLKLLPPQG